MGKSRKVKCMTAPFIKWLTGLRHTKRFPNIRAQTSFGMTPTFQKKKKKERKKKKKSKVGVIPKEGWAWTD